MNLRSLVLLLVFLLLPAGQAAQYIQKDAVLVKAQACPMACCQHAALVAANTCGCLDDTRDSTPPAPIPNTPPPQGRDWIPHLVWTVVAAITHPHPQETLAAHFCDLNALAPRLSRVSLALLHCALLT